MGKWQMGSEKLKLNDKKKKKPQWQHESRDERILFSLNVLNKFICSKRWHQNREARKEEKREGAMEGMPKEDGSRPKGRGQKGLCK